MLASQVYEENGQIENSELSTGARKINWSIEGLVERQGPLARRFRFTPDFKHFSSIWNDYEEQMQIMMRMKCTLRYCERSSN